MTIDSFERARQEFFGRDDASSTLPTEQPEPQQGSENRKSETQTSGKSGEVVR
jgi:hypothetical protein